MAPPRMSQSEWARQNPPRSGESFEEYTQRYEEETKPGILGNALESVEQFGRGAGLGLTKTATSFGSGIGEITGSPTLRRLSREAEQGATEFFNPQGTAGSVGEFVGRATGEIGTALTGGGLVAKGLLKAAPKLVAKAPRAASLAATLGKGANEGTALQRALASAATSLPIDLIQGAAQKEGMLLKSPEGAMLENVLFSAGGGALSGAMDARRAAKAKRLKEGEEAAAMVGPFQASAIPDEVYGPFQASERVITDPRRLLTARTGVTRIPGPAPDLPARPAKGTRRTTKAEMRQKDRLVTMGDEATDEQIAEFMLREDGIDPTPEMISQYAQQIRREATTRPAMQGASRRTRKSVGDLALETAEDMKGSALTTAEKQSVRGKKPAKIRSGATEAELLSSISGGGIGALYGAGTAETEEERLARALLFGGLGAGAGYGAGRFFANGVTPSTPRTEQVEQLTRSIQKGDITPPKMDATPMSPFPKNRQPLLNRSGLTPAERQLVGMDDKVAKMEGPTLEWSPKLGEKEYYRQVEQGLKRGLTPDELASIDPRRATPQEAGMALAANRNANERIMALLDQAKRTTDPDELARLQDEIELFDGISNKLLSQVMKMDRASGQSLAARRYMAKQITDPMYWQLKGSKAKQGAPLTLDEKAQVDKLIAAGDPEKLMQYMGRLQKSSTLEQLASLRAAGLLTAIPGRLRDLISTSANYAMTALQRYPGAGVDALISKAVSRKLGGDVAQYRSMALPSTQEFKAAFGGGQQGLERAKASMGFGQRSMAEWVEFMRNAELDPEMIKTLDIPHQVNIDMFNRFGKMGEKASGVLDTYAKTVMRASGVTDKIIKGAALEGALAEQATLDAMRRGLKGAQLQEYVAKVVKDPDLLDDELKLNAALTADYITFTNNGKAADSLSRMIESVATVFGRNNPRNAALVRAGARFIMPFRRTPANILSRALEYAPGSGQALAFKSALDWNRELANAALSGAGRSSVLAAKQRKMVERLTAQATGLGMFALGAHLYRNGVLTGEVPEDRAEQEQWRTEGKQPESLLINGQWIPISRISPFGGMMTMAASVMQNAREKGETLNTRGALQTALENPFEAGATVGRSLLNQPMVTGPKDMLEAMTNRRLEESQGLISNMAGSLVPSFVAQAARAEGRQRLPQSAKEAITSRIPGMQETAPERLNIFGQPTQKAGGFINTMINPMTSTADVREQDPLVRELSSVGANIPAMKRKTDETMEMYQYRQREAGAFVREDLEALVGTEEYQVASADEKRRMLQDAAQKARRDFDRYLKETFAISPED